MSNFDFTDLILLVGTNPLPNYVVGKWFIGENRGLERVWLVHTNRTGGAKEPLQAERLRDTIANELKFPIQNIKLVNTEHESSAKEIRKKTKDLMISEIEKLKGKVHLNYTGGTKSMSVHVYNEILKSNIQSKEFSYLEAQDFKLLRDNPDNPVIEENMRERVKIKFDEELLKIHGYIRHGIGKKDFLDKIQPFYKIFEKDLFGDYISLIEKSLKEKDFNDIVNCKNSELKNLIFDLLQNLPDGYKIIDKNNSYNKLNKNPNSFLLREWLEYYVYDIIKNNFEFDNASLELDCKVKHPSWNKDYFQIDILLLNKYQLIGISTTITGIKKNDDDFSTCKLKGFEIIHRVKQMGGDEARAILLTGLSKTQSERLQDELINETGSDGSLKVLGIEDWKKEYIIEAIKEATK